MDLCQVFVLYLAVLYLSTYPFGGPFHYIQKSKLQVHELAWSILVSLARLLCLVFDTPPPPPPPPSKLIGNIWALCNLFWRIKICIVDNGELKCEVFANTIRLFQKLSKIQRLHNPLSLISEYRYQLYTDYPKILDRK